MFPLGGLHECPRGGRRLCFGTVQDVSFHSSDLQDLCPSLVVPISDFAQVLHEAQVGRRHGHEVLYCELHCCICVQNLLVAASLCIEFCQSQSCLTCVPYLPAIPSFLVVIFPICGDDFQNLVFIYGNLPGLLRKAPLDQTEIQLEDFLGRSELKMWIVQTYVNTRCESLVEITDPVSCQE